MGNRRHAREFALQMLYPIDLAGDTDVDAAITLFWKGLDEAPPSEVEEYASLLVRGVARERPELDALIEKVSLNWRLSRMPHVDRNILRIGVYELLKCPDVPPMVTINEAIELGKTFSTRESGAFINGILDRIARTVPLEKVDPRRP